MQNQVNKQGEDYGRCHQRRTRQHATYYLCPTMGCVMQQIASDKGEGERGITLYEMRENLGMELRRYQIGHMS